MKNELNDEQILALLKTFKSKRRPPRFYKSLLYPYTAELVSLFYQGASYGDMCWYLSEKFDVHVSRSTVWRYLCKTLGKYEVQSRGDLAEL